jgi:hypothetical protein
MLQSNTIRGHAHQPQAAVVAFITNNAVTLPKAQQLLHRKPTHRPAFRLHSALRAAERASQAACIAAGLAPPVIPKQEVTVRLMSATLPAVRQHILVILLPQADLSGDLSRFANQIS